MATLITKFLRFKLVPVAEKVFRGLTVYKC